MALMALMVVYPILFTIGVSFTNYGLGHLVTKQLAIRQIEAQTYLAADSPIYSWAAYQNVAGDYLLWLTDPDTGAGVHRRTRRRAGRNAAATRSRKWTATPRSP